MSSGKEIPSWAFNAVRAILETLKAKDPHTFYHCCRVGRNARLLGKSAGMDEYTQNILEYSGLLHDVGKVGIPDQILFKPAKLSAEEIHMMKMHPVKSLQIIKPLLDDPFFQDVAPGVELHHERLDGLGYPYGLKSKDISMEVRVITLVDAIDAMVSTRPYRKGMSMDRVLEEIKRCVGTQFDETLVKVYIESYQSWNQEIKNIKEGEQIAHSLLKVAS
ncbi:MAG: HD domain-containing protein [Bdellovibrionaceae bacterium]|nr:HD domain-containing protein [Pseudobdellovibrionaceae bacterium]